MKIIISENLQARSNGRLIADKYRAVLFFDASDIEGATIKFYQPIRGQWYGVGSWYLSTLTDGAQDGLYIDFGQNWLIESGIIDAVTFGNRVIKNILNIESMKITNNVEVQ